MSQMALPLAWPVGDAEADFIIAPSNAAAVRLLRATGTWPVHAAILTGPRKSGRSLFGRIFAAAHGGVLIDDAEQRDEAAIFHAWNAAQARHEPLLIIADHPPPAWSIALPDLRSRLLASPHARFEDADPVLVEQLLMRLCQRRGLALAPELARWIALRIERSHRAVIALVDRLDVAALSQRRMLTMALVRDVLSEDVDGGRASG